VCTNSTQYFWDGKATYLTGQTRSISPHLHLFARWRRTTTSKNDLEDYKRPVADLQGMPGMHRHTLRFRQLQTYLGVKNKHTRQTIKAQPSSNRVLEQAGRVYVRPMRPRGARYLCDVRRRTEGLTHGRNYERLGSHLQHAIHASSSCRVSCRRYDPDRGTALGSPDHQTSLPCHPCCTPVLWVHWQTTSSWICDHNC
jgi:hypothetical protein